MMVMVNFVLVAYTIFLLCFDFSNVRILNCFKSCVATSSTLLHRLYSSVVRATSQLCAAAVQSRALVYYYCFLLFSHLRRRPPGRNPTEFQPKSNLNPRVGRVGRNPSQAKPTQNQPNPTNDNPSRGSAGWDCVCNADPQAAQTRCFVFGPKLGATRAEKSWQHAKVLPGGLPPHWFRIPFGDHPLKLERYRKD